MQISNFSRYSRVDSNYLFIYSFIHSFTGSAHYLATNGRVEAVSVQKLLCNKNEKQRKRKRRRGKRIIILHTQGICMYGIGGYQAPDVLETFRRI